MTTDASLLADVYSLLLADIRANRARGEAQQCANATDRDVNSNVPTCDSSVESNPCLDSSVNDQ
jgi:hypothetical protein